MDESVIVIDKGAGPSSFDVVREVRRWTKIKKVGHAGSLDPFATGVLVVLTGKATKLSNALLNADKRYEAVIKLGEATDSMDCTGKVTETCEITQLTQAQIEKVLISFEGQWNQIPPMYSAKKIKGVRLYELARKNISIVRQAIPVQLYSVRLVSYEAPFLKFQVHCSKGTYVRSLGDEIAKKLGTVGHLTELRRLTCGRFTLEQSLTLEAFKKSASTWQQDAYRNYMKLLTTEGVVRTQKQTPGESGEGRQKSENSNLSAREFSHLPTKTNNGMSLLN